MGSPVVGVRVLLVATTLGVTVAESTRELVAVLSPTNAYSQAMEPVYTGVVDQYEVFATFQPGADRLARQTWFSVTVLLGWATILPAIGYAKFRAAELG